MYMVKSVNKATCSCVARQLFYPLFTACLRWPKWLRSEEFVVLLTFMLGFTNGYLTSVIMILPSEETNGILCGAVCDSKYLDTFSQFESGGASGSGGCGDEEEGADHQEDEDEDGDDDA
nr:equilibrative nucleotide transporter 8 [Tanacetum cinerariifolium]